MMTRRDFLAATAAVLVTGCFDDRASGPVDIAWDRDACALCNMLISDARFAAQVRGGPKRKVWKFDDIGCAVNWLNKQPWAADPDTEIWVADHRSTRDAVTWLDARAAYYVPDVLSPMNYNYAARPKPADGAVRFEALTSIILADVPNHICPVPGHTAKAEG